ncbi:hypothetical protein ACHAXR_001541 [Thalassiosira sp. AJA248-18]
MAMNGAFTDIFWKACEVELNTLVNDMKTWKFVERTPDMHVLPCSTWAFKIKRFPDGLVKKFKARFCVRGDQQKHGINYWETWSLVVQWPAVRTIMILAAKEKLVSTQCDITAAFVAAPIPKDEVVYVHQPRGFIKDPRYVLKLNSCLYGTKKSPRYFFGTREAGASSFEARFCLFLGNGLIVITHGDDILIYGIDKKEINNLIERLNEDSVHIPKEGTAEGYLSLSVVRDGNKTTLSQPGLIKRIVEGLGISSKFLTPV